SRIGQSLTSLKDKLMTTGARSRALADMSSSKMAEVAIHAKCSGRFGGSSRNCGRSHYQRWCKLTATAHSQAHLPCPAARDCRLSSIGMRGLQPLVAMRPYRNALKGESETSRSPKLTHQHQSLKATEFCNIQQANRKTLLILSLS